MTNKEIELYIMNYFTELFLSDKECSDTIAMLDAERQEALESGNADKYYDINNELYNQIMNYMVEAKA